MKKKIAIVFGITGQDGSYLTELLIKKNYIVHGVIRRSSSINTNRIDHLYQEPLSKNKTLYLHYGDLTDSSLIFKIINEIKPNEIYNLAAQSNVALSFLQPSYTFQVNAMGTLSILESIKTLNLSKKTKLYHAATSEMFGNSSSKSLSEKTVFKPVSPYGTSKLAAHNLILNYRKSYNIFAVSGILFNHESPRRGDTFVTKKIIKTLCQIKNNKKECLYLGNIYSKRDWGHAKDYVKMQWKMLQIKNPTDYVISTGKSYTIKQFINLTLKKLNLDANWSGKGLNEVCTSNGKIIIRISNKYFRPNELNYLQGDSSLAKKDLGWKPTYNINQLIDEMISYELNNI